MNRTLVTLAVVGAAMLVGCASPEGGQMGDHGFKIVVPMFDVGVKQGETATTKVWLDRGKYFKQDVDLAMTVDPGISVEPEKATVLASEKAEVYLQITAPLDAALGEYRVHIEGTPQEGQPTRMNLKVKVKSP
jgi:uncharacterized membrane protein